MSTATVPLTITCPDWCVVDAAEHVADMWNLGGDCFHRTADILVEDPSEGPAHSPLDDGRPANPAELWLLVTTTPDGRETSTPMFNIDCATELSLEHMDAVATAMQQLTATYREWKATQR